VAHAPKTVTAILELVGANETLDFLLGRWRVERTVTDHRGEDQSHFRGTATFSRRTVAGNEHRTDRVHFDEVGEYSLGEYHGEARRSLEYVASADSGVTINFADGHHFITLDLARGESHDEHLCNLDHYEITTIVKDRDLLEEQWRVEGPGKNYEAVSLLERVTDER
jgi:hypothetical protein